MPIIPGDPSTTTCGIAANCSDICINENGKEVCYCHPGFHLALDKRTCEGKLHFANNTDIIA